MFDADRTLFYGLKQCSTGKNNGKSQDRPRKGAERPSDDREFDEIADPRQIEPPALNNLHPASHSEPSGDQAHERPRVGAQRGAMNIADRGRLYAEIHRVLKPGGCLGLYDVTAGETAPLLFLVPWARTPEISFLLTPAAMRAARGAAGFTAISWEDKTAAGVAGFAEQAAAGPGQTTSPPGLQVLMGPKFDGMAANLGRNLREGRIGLTQAIVRRG